MLRRSALMALTRKKRGTGGSSSGAYYYDEQNYTKGSYIAYCAPWSIYTPPQNAFVRGVDYEDSIEVFPEFPLNNVIRWRWPSGAYSTTGVYGYMAISYGNADGGVPETLVTPRQVGDLTSFSQEVAFEYLSGAENAGMLNEIYVTTEAGNAAAKVYEIAAFLHTTERTRSFHATGSLIGVYTDPQGRQWTARNVGPGGTGAPYLIFMRTGGEDAQGTINFKGFLDFLITNGYAIAHLWVNGVACGPEPDIGSGAVRLSYTTAIVGAGVVIPPPASNLVLNGNFDNDGTWIGYWFSGKSYDYGAARAIFNDGSGLGPVSPYDGLRQPISFVAGKYYDVTFTITRTAGAMVARFTGGTERRGTERSASGTYTQRLLANTGNNEFNMSPWDAGFQGTLDSVILTGPYDTP